MLRLSVLLSAI